MSGQNQKNTVEAREKAELGAMHIQNLTLSELKRKNPLLKVEIQSTYHGVGVISATTPSGDPTYNVTYKDYQSKYPLEYYNHKHDLYKELNLEKK